MLIAYPPPALNTVALTNATWAGTTSGKLTDGQPATLARLTTSGTPSITLTFASAFVPRVIPLLGLRGAIAAGDIVTATTGAGGALGGNSASQAVVQLPDGSLACWIITGGTVSTTTIKITINRTGTLDIGEVAAMPGVDLGLRDGWTSERIDPSPKSRTRGQQVVTRTLRSYRRFSGLITPAAVEAVRKGGLAGGMDWDTLSARLSGGARCAVIPQYHDMLTKLPDYALAQKEAVYGVAVELPGPSNLQRQYFSAGIAVEEVPPL